MGQTIYNAVVELRSKSRIATRPVLAEITNQTMSVVDYHVQRLVNDGRLRRVLNGVYEPVPPTQEDRAVSFTVLPGHACKLEVGDHVLELTWAEARMVSIAVAGVSVHFAQAVALPAG